MQEVALVIADDDRSFRQTVCRILKNLPNNIREVREAGSPEVAQKRVRELVAAGYRVVLLADINMPDLDGGFARLVDPLLADGTLRPNQIIMMSALFYWEEIIKREVNFLSKPLQKGPFEDALREAMKQE